MRKVYIVKIAGENNAVFGNIREVYKWLQAVLRSDITIVKLDNWGNWAGAGAEVSYNYNNLAAAFKAHKSVKIYSSGETLARVELHYLNEHVVK